MRRLAIATLATAALAGRATGHVQPSVDDNNRFLKLTPLGDRVRLAYTVLFGEGSADAMNTIATETGGSVFNAQTTSLQTIFKQIRGYQ